jgi:hypothetical protein
VVVLVVISLVTCICNTQAAVNGTGIMIIGGSKFLLTHNGGQGENGSGWSVSTPTGRGESSLLSILQLFNAIISKDESRVKFVSQAGENESEARKLRKQVAVMLLNMWIMQINPSLGRSLNKKDTVNAIKKGIKAQGKFWPQDPNDVDQVNLTKQFNGVRGTAEEFILWEIFDNTIIPETQGVIGQDPNSNIDTVSIGVRYEHNTKLKVWYWLRFIVVQDEITHLGRIKLSCEITKCVQ